MREFLVELADADLDAVSGGCIISCRPVEICKPREDPCKKHEDHCKKPVKECEREIPCQKNPCHPVRVC